MTTKSAANAFHLRSVLRFLRVFVVFLLFFALSRVSRRLLAACKTLLSLSGIYPPVSNSLPHDTITVQNANILKNINIYIIMQNNIKILENRIFHKKKARLMIPSDNLLNLRPVT